MADLPQFRSQRQILSGMVDTFLSELDRTGISPGIQSIKPGSPYLASFVSVGLAVMRAQQQTLALLDANDLDRATGDALDRLGAKERLQRRGATYGRGSVVFSDASFTRRTTKVYQGKPAPIPGVQTIYASDASLFPATGSIYIGRGTSSLEGPLAYTERHAEGSYWVITLQAPTQKHHFVTETITLAQGGDRLVSAGQVVSTVEGNAATPVTYVTTQAVTLLDGETESDSVPVVCQARGVAGNVAANALREVKSPAFQGMAVSNALPISNALDIEADDHYRERIRQAKQTRERATKLAIESRAYGIQAQDESSTITSARFVKRSLLPSVLVIDDGAGYEEKDSGAAHEVLVDSANGGETTFYLTFGRPVAKASVVTTQKSPFTIGEGATLGVRVGGAYYEHSFQATDFRDPNAATAFEAVASINRNPSIPFAARTTSAGSKFAIFARGEENDDVQVTVPTNAAVLDANETLGFPVGRVDTLRVYLNDRLLKKDGRRAVVTSAAQTEWSQLSSPETLTISVDGTGATTYSITDADFASNTQFPTVSGQNSLAAWAAVLNHKVPGISCTVAGSTLEIASNRGASNAASIEISGSCSLVAHGMFRVSGLTASGANRDYVLDRNLGQVELASGLAAGDRLTAGTTYSRSYVSSGALTSAQVPAGGAHLWFVVDGAAEVLSTGLNGAVSLAVSQAADSPMRRISATVGGSPAAVFSGITVGDWAIFKAQQFLQCRVARVATDLTWFEVEMAPAATSYTMQGLDVSFVRSGAVPQRVTVAAGTYDANALASAISIRGAAVSVVGTRVRLTTNTHGADGDIALVAQDGAGSVFGFSVGLVSNDVTGYATIESVNSDVGTPSFEQLGALTYSNPAALTVGPFSVGDALTEGAVLAPMFMRPLSNASAPSRYGTHSYQAPSAVSYDGATSYVALDALLAGPADPVVTGIGNPDRIVPVRRFMLGPESTLELVIDESASSNSYSVPVFRRVRADSAVPYGTTIRLLDLDNMQGGTPQSLSSAFGQSFSFQDFVLHGRARGITHSADTTKSVLWRMKHFRGTAFADVRYAVPVSDTVKVRWNGNGDVNIHLPCGTRRALTGYQTGSQVFCASAGGSTSLVSAWAISGISRTGTTVTVTVDTLGMTPTSLGFGVGSRAYISVPGFETDFPTGYKTVASVVAGTGTITYVEDGAATSATPVGGYVAQAPSPADLSAAQIGDLVHIDAGWAVSGGFDTQVTARVTTNNPWHIQLQAAPPTPNQWAVAQTADDILIYQFTAPTASAVVTAVNALSDSPITGTLLGTGAGTITTWNIVTDPAAEVRLADGLVHIGSSAYVGGGTQNYDLTLKSQPTAALAALPNDWANEEFRLVPTTAKNVADFLAQPTVSGLASAGISVQTAARAGRVQVTSGTFGSTGAVRVTGGSANAIRVPVVGSAVTNGSYLNATVRIGNDLAALGNRFFVEAQNTVPLPKNRGWTGATTIQVVSSLLTASSGCWTSSGDIFTNTNWLVERCGRFVAYTRLSVGAVNVPAAGNWVYIKGATVGSATNTGTFRVVASSGNTFWVENQNAVDGEATFALVAGLTYHSVVPGDTISIATPALGAAIQGQWLVTDIDATSAGASVYVRSIPDCNVTLGASSSFVKVIPNAPSRQFHEVVGIMDGQGGTSTFILRGGLPELLTASAGTVFTVLDRLGFETQTVKGLDGYRYNTGLIAEANKVLYGDERDDQTYPGYIAAGASINIGAPLIRRIQVKLAIRERSGANAKGRVQAAIAQVINGYGAQPIPISKLIEAAQKVPGVISVVFLSPTPTTSADTIPVQPGERAVVLDLDTDIQVSVIGQ